MYSLSGKVRGLSLCFSFVELFTIKWNITTVAKSDLSLQLTFLTALLSLEEEQDEEMLHQIDIQVLQYIWGLKINHQDQSPRETIVQIAFSRWLICKQTILSHKWQLWYIKNFWHSCTTLQSKDSILIDEKTMIYWIIVLGVTLLHFPVYRYFRRKPTKTCD